MELCEFQKIDPSNGMVMPWLTWPALDEISNWDIKDKVIWQWGAGYGDAWLGNRCKFLFSIERNHDWLVKAAVYAADHGVDNISWLHRECNEGSGQYAMYCETEPTKPDIFIVDDAYRYECILKAIEHKPCTLIVDNYQQDYVFICPAAEDALKDYEGQFFVQPDHQNHEGRPWTTAIWHLK